MPQFPRRPSTGYSFVGGLEIMNFTASALTTIAVTNAQTVVSNSGGSELLVFSNDSNSHDCAIPRQRRASGRYELFECCPEPARHSQHRVRASLPVSTGPSMRVVNGNTAYILNCGPQCGGNMASVMVFDLPSLTVTSTIPVDAATWALLNGSTLYVAGTSPTNNCVHRPDHCSHYLRAP